MAEQLIKRKEVLRRLARSSAQFQRDLKAGLFPPPAKYLGRSPRWSESQISKFMLPTGRDASHGVLPMLTQHESTVTAVDVCKGRDREHIPIVDRKNLSEYFHRVLISVIPATAREAVLVANILNTIMPKAEWCGTYAVVLSDGAVEFIWPKASGTEPDRMMSIIDDIFKKNIVPQGHWLPGFGQT